MSTPHDEPPQLNLFSVALMHLVLNATLRPFWGLKVIGKQNIPREGPCFLYGNHSNYLDPFVTNLFLGWNVTAGVMAREYLQKGLIAWLMRSIGILPVSRNHRSLIAAISRLIEHNRKIFIYPEGGRRWDGRPLPWIRSTVKLYQKTGLPVYPVIVHGSYVAWPRWATYPRPARLKIEFRPPMIVDPSWTIDEALVHLKAPIDFDENRVPGDVKPHWAYRPADGVSILLYRDPFTGDDDGLFTPDGRHVRNADGSLQYRMHPDSTLEALDSGEIATTGELYARIRALPLPRTAAGHLLENDVAVHLAPTFPHFEPHGRMTARLYDDALRLTGRDSVRTIPLDAVQFAQVERNWKFQITTNEGVTQLGFLHGGSALQWLDTVTDLGLPTR